MSAAATGTHGPESGDPALGRTTGATATGSMASLGLGTGIEIDGGATLLFRPRRARSSRMSAVKVTW